MKRLGFGFKEEDEIQLKKLVELISKEQGQISQTQAIRMALREAVSRREREK